MPQLILATFPSQIFWVLIGFLLVYLFVSKVVTPEIEEILGNRMAHMEDLQKVASKLKVEADNLERDSFVILENAQMESADKEAKVVSSFIEKSIKEKKSLHNLFYEKSNEESLIISKSADKAFANIAGDIETILDMAMKTVACSVRDKS